jgi:hypothetical protein
MKEEDKDHNAGVSSSRVLFCDMRCEYARFPEDEDIDGAGSCRTFAAIYCSKIEEYVTKNAPCPARFGRRRPKTSW